MSNLHAAIDETNDGEYISILIGDSESIRRNEKKLPSNFKHMTSIESKDDKLNIIKAFDFTGNIFACCAKIGLPQLREKIDCIQKTTRKSQRKVSNSLAYEFRYSLQSICKNFLIDNSITLEELKIEVDNDLIRNYLHTTNCNVVSPNQAHKIADCIVHANGKHWRVNQDIKEFGTRFTIDFHKKVLSRAFRK
jgi:hypothetical protein